ncbi:hypothetical protein ACO2Q3_00575 [Caulobacter sp. KR2-114]|uniref:hypothetical protein n=1 Tax=Caulobacter sp. KR2-114 TaxID=3400912 RepID=UPI003C0075CC
MATPCAADDSADLPIALNVINRAPPAIVDQPALFTADDLLLLEVDSDGYRLSDGMSAFSSRSGLFLPLGELSRLFDLAINVDWTRGSAEGWVLTRGRVFQLDLPHRRARIGDRDLEIEPAQAAVFDGDIYLRTDLLERLLPLKFKAQVHDLVLDATPTEQMPFQARLARDQIRARLANGPAAEDVLKVRTPYAAFTPPAADIDISAEAGNRGERSLAYTFRASGDLAYAGFQAFVSSDTNARPSDVRLLLERKDPEGHGVGAPLLTRANIGDTYTPGLQLGARSAGGRGVFFTSEPITQASVFDRTNIRGDLPTGYEVELYVNEVLRASQSGAGDGRYAFDNVELAFGLNTIRLVFYGPRGERREEVRRINVGAGALTKGQFTFALGAVQEGTPLVDIRHQPPLGTILPGYGRPRIVGDIAYGLTRLTTVSAGFADYTPQTGSRRQMGMLTLATSTAGFAVQGLAGLDSRGGAALAVGLAGRPLGVSLVGRYAEYLGGFVDELQPGGVGNGSPLRRNATLNVDFAPQLAGASLPLSLRLSEDGYADGGQRFEGSAHASKPIGRYLASASLDYQQFSAGGLGSRTLTGGTEVAAIAGGGWQLRGAMAYQLLPQARLSALSLTVQRNYAQRMAIQVAASHSFGPGAGTTLSFANTLRLRLMDASLTGSYDSATHDVRIGLRLATGFMFNPLRRRYEAVGPGAAAGGAVLIDSFVDVDADGRRGKTEKPVPGVGVTGGRYDIATDAHGEALVTGLGDGASARIHLDTEKLDDPYLVGPPRAIEIVPRPGRVAVVPYPFVATSEVEVKAVFRRGAALRGLSALSLQLVDAQGKVLRAARTEYDGTALFEEVPPGSYVLRVDPEQAARLHLGFARNPGVVARPQGGFAGQITGEVVVQP